MFQGARLEHFGRILVDHLDTFVLMKLNQHIQIAALAAGDVKLMRNMSPKEIIRALKLKPHPTEGGYFRETYRSVSTITVERDGAKDSITRSLSTQIYYLITDRSFSTLHRLKQDEVFHYYGGQAAEIFLILPDGGGKFFHLGGDISNGEVPQVVVPAMTWQGLRLPTGVNGWCLMGSTVTPGFDYADFELGSREKLIGQFPNLKELITLYTRD